MIAAFVAGLLGYGCWVVFRLVLFRVEEGHLGVLSAFGGARRGADGQLSVYSPGLHAKRPWEKVSQVSLQEQALELTGEHGGQLAMAADGTTLRLDAMVRYALVPAKLDEFLFGMRAPVEHLTGLFGCLLRNELANLSAATEETDPGAYALIRRERRLLNERLATVCREELEQRSGVRFTAVHLVDIHPPDELAEALNAVMTARVEAQTTLARAESETSQRVLAARDGLAVAELNAEAVEREITELTRHLAELEAMGVLEAYVERRRAEVVAEAQTVYLETGARR
jgi:regulator of protease activity HflC (stomatin/prohibitin superfamily)